MEVLPSTAFVCLLTAENHLVAAFYQFKKCFNISSQSFSWWIGILFFFSFFLPSQTGENPKSKFPKPPESPCTEPDKICDFKPDCQNKEDEAKCGASARLFHFIFLFPRREGFLESWPFPSPCRGLLLPRGQLRLDWHQHREPRLESA